MVQEAAEIHTAVSLVGAGFGVTLVPATMRAEHPAGVVYRALSAPAPITELAMVYRPDDASPILAAFLRVAREIIGATGARDAK